MMRQGAGLLLCLLAVLVAAASVAGVLAHGRRSRKAAARWPRHTRGGVCDVCARPLSGRVAYRVPKDVFYASRKWRAYARGQADATRDRPVSDAEIEAMRAGERAKCLSVCEDCIHMFP